MTEFVGILHCFLLRIGSCPLPVVVWISLLLSSTVSAELTLELKEDWHSVFAGQRTLFHVNITSTAAGSVRLAWSLRVKQRTVARREQEFKLTAMGATTAEIDLKMPPVKAGVVIPVDFELSAWLTKSPETVEKLTRRLWVFPDDAFANRHEWLRGLRIHLFDPEGQTEQVLEQAGVPFELVQRPTVLEEESSHVTIVVGAGVSLLDYPRLDDALIRLARQGHRVLFLAPDECELTLPGATAMELPLPTQLVFRRHDIIGELDKRLDAEAWPPDSMLKATGLRVETIGARIAWTVTPEETGWPWVAATFGSGGRFVVCGFPIIEKWQSGPTPRFQLLRIFEWIDQAPDGDKQLTGSLQKPRE